VQTSKIRVEPFLDGQALRVVLDAPKGNVLDSVMMAEILGLLDDLGARRELKLLCFVGAGEHFSFGASVPEHVRDKAPAMLAAFHRMFLRLGELAIPTAAVVRGRCLGGGMELAAFCNWVLAHPGALFGQPEIELGVLAPIASLILPLRLGQSRSDDLLLTGRLVGAEEAQHIGLATRVADDPWAALEELAAKQLLPKSASSLRHAVRAARWEWNRRLAADVAAMERFYLDELMATHDANEGLASFMEKRRPVWTNA
jgi:cyclohexa-1,5-dienecarbonyl-CoA hydratase